MSEFYEVVKSGEEYIVVQGVKKFADIREANKYIDYLKSDAPAKEIIDHLNSIAGTRYRNSNRNNLRYISARLRDGYSAEELKAVINTKALQWLNDPQMRKYLRPQTLFDNGKFECYINEALLEEKGNMKGSSKEVELY